MPETFESHFNVQEVERNLQWDDQRLAGDAPTAYSPTESIAFSFGYNHAIEVAKEHTYSGEWVEGRWWRVIAPDGSLWCETSDEHEARRSIRHGDILQRLYKRQQHEWRTVE